MSIKNLVIIFCLGALLYFVWSYLIDSLVSPKEIPLKKFVDVQVTYKPSELIVILSHEKGGN